MALRTGRSTKEQKELEDLDGECLVFQATPEDLKRIMDSVKAKRERTGFAIHDKVYIHLNLKKKSK